MENDTIYPIVYNKDYYTVMANDIIKGKQDMSLQEARIIRLLITQVVKQDKDFKTYTCRIQDLAKFLNVPSANMYRDIRCICSNLMQSVVKIGTGNPKQPWKIIQWLQLAEYDGNGNITLMLSNQIKPYVIALDKWFTQYQLGNILSMQSFYSIRLYELIKCHDGITREGRDYHEFSITYLREFFCCEKKYERISQFKQKVIKTAVLEINQKTDIWIDITYVKKGRSINSVKFFITPNVKNTLTKHMMPQPFEEVTI